MTPKSEFKKMMGAFPDTELVQMERVPIEGVGTYKSICAACPAHYPETILECALLECGKGTVFVSPTLYLVATVNKW